MAPCSLPLTLPPTSPLRRWIPFAFSHRAFVVKVRYFKTFAVQRGQVATKSERGGWTRLGCFALFKSHKGHPPSFHVGEKQPVWIQAAFREKTMPVWSKGLLKCRFRAAREIRLLCRCWCWIYSKNKFVVRLCSCIFNPVIVEHHERKKIQPSSFQSSIPSQATITNCR